MPFTEFSWNVEYESGVITEQAWRFGFKRLAWTQTVRGPSYAVHVIQCKFQSDDKPMQEKILKEVNAIAHGDVLKFRVCKLQGGDPDKGPWQNHLVYDWNFRSSSSGFLLVLKTMDFTAKAMVETRTRAHNGSSVDAIARKLMEEHGLEFDAVETCQTIPHFQVLLQRNMTDAQFLTNELIPRAVSKDGKGGYLLFTSDGKKARFQTLNYNYPEPKFQPDPLSLVDVREREQSFQAGRLGGGIYTVHAFDPFLKKPYVVSAGAEVNPSLGKAGPRVIPTRYEYVPLQTKDAALAWARARQYTNRYEAYPIRAEVKGTPGLTIPMFFDLSLTKYRDSIPGALPVVQIQHVLTRGRLRQFVYLLRDKYTP